MCEPAVKGRQINCFRARVRLWYPGLPPLEGGHFSYRHLGLKPQAESYRPFGAETKSSGERDVEHSYH